ncbi:MAG: hypothetical protein IPP79_21215 [Chitinophagaceae bacterium]|nr:hypothetical protein [Chitinophagaceae bacterium]
MIDLTGDGKADLLITEDNAFFAMNQQVEKGFVDSYKTEKAFEEEAGPHVIFSNPDQSIFLADMNGDGMTDIVRMRNGEVCYWPNMGYGKFGGKIGMDNAPIFDHPDSFNPSYIRLADIDGSGTTDIIYLGKNKFSCWKNLSGNLLVKPIRNRIISGNTFPFKITVTDLLGNGVACIVWSSLLSKDASSPIKYIDLMNSKKPHIMVSYKNNLGKEVTFEYTPSTKFYIEDKLAGKPWVTKLHFPVHCISKTITEDKISGYRFVNEYKYHHGYYDHAEREFRGFGMVEQVDTETFEHWEKGNASNIVENSLDQEPVVSKTWSHIGAFLQKDKILSQFANEYWFEEMNKQGFSVPHHELSLPDAILIAAPGIDSAILNTLSTQEWREAFRACKGMVLRTEVLQKMPLKMGILMKRKKELTPFSVATHNCIIN